MDCILALLSWLSITKSLFITPIVILALFQPLEHPGLASLGLLEAVKQTEKNCELMKRMHLQNLNSIAPHLAALNNLNGF